MLIVAGTILLAFPLLYLLAPLIAASLSILSSGAASGFGGAGDFGIAADYEAVVWLLLMSIAGSASLTSGAWQLSSKPK